MPEPIVIRVVNKRPVRVSGEPVVVCDNSDYTVVWQLDEEWSGTATMRVVYSDGSSRDVILTDNAGALPVVPEPGTVLLGLYAGDIHTTRPVKLLGVRSILTDGERLYPPSEDVYAQLIKKLDQKLDSNLGTENSGKFLAVDKDGNIVPESGAAGGGTLYEGTKSDLSASDGSIIEAYFAAHTDITPKAGDVFIVNTVINGKEYEKSSYYFSGAAWEAVTGCVDADKVIAHENLLLAGDFDRIGNWVKDKNGTKLQEIAGMSFMAILKDIGSKTLQPTITANPSINGFGLIGAAAVEAGTPVATASYLAATLNPGSYKYGPKAGTGVVASNWKVERITDSGAEQVASVDAASLPAGSDNNGGNGFIIGDAGGDNAVASLKYRVTATHGAGVQAEDNLGGASNPAAAIAAGTKTKDSAAYTPFRNFFSGATAEKPTLDSTYIRGLTKSNKAYAAGVITVNVPAGAYRVVIACIAGKTGVTKVTNETALNADVTDTFAKKTVAVEGANGYTAKDYNVWVFEPAVPYENPAVLKVTLG